MKKNKNSAERELEGLRALSNPIYIYILTPILLIILTISVYSPVFNFGFIDFDDLSIINRALNSSETNTLKLAFNSDPYFGVKDSEFYRPLQNITILFDINNASEKFNSYHATNLILHLAVVICLYIFLVCLNIERLISTLLALLYAIHPLFSFAVAWIPARGDLLVSIFILLSSINWISYLKDRRKVSFYLTNLFFLLAVLSKEIALIYPLIVLILTFTYSTVKVNDLKYNHRKQLVPLLLSFAGIIILFLILKNMVLNNSVLSGVGLNLSAILSNLRYIPTFISKFILPVNLSGMSQFKTFPIIFGTATILASTSLIIFRLRDKWKDFIFPASWFILFLLPVVIYSKSYIASGEYWEHRAYLPSVGLIIFLGLLYKDLQLSKKFFIILISPIILLLSILTIVSVNNYSNSYQFYNNIIMQENRLANAYFGRGAFYKDNGQMDEALKDLNSAIEIDNNYFEAYFKRGVIFYKGNETDRAIKDFRRANDLMPGFSDTYYNLGLCLLRKQDTLNSILCFEECLRYDQNNLKASQILINLRK